MEAQKFWLAVVLATIAGIVILNISWLILSLAFIGRIHFSYYPYFGKDLVFLVGKQAVFSLLTALILTAGFADRTVRNGFKVGAFCGLISYILSASSRLSEGDPLGQVIYYFLLFGIIGGITGAIIMRIVRRTG